jgi:hypothetical protein
MAVQVRDVARQVVANLGQSSGYELAAQWIGQRYAELCGKAKFRHLRELGQLYLPAPLQSGTCTVTFDSPLVQLNATAQAAAAAQTYLNWPDGYTGLWFRPQIGITWYRIAQANANTGVITLETPFAFDNSYLVTSPTPPPPVFQNNIPFYILPRYQQLDPRARQLGVFLADFIFRPLTLVSQDEMNARYGSRFLVSTYPQFVSEFNTNFDLQGMPKQVEIYPYPTNSVTIHYTYWKTPVALNYDDYIPPTIDPDILRTGATIDMANNRMGDAVRKGNLEQAAFYRNIANQEETKFAQKTNRAIRDDKGAEDLKFILQRSSWRQPLDWDPNKDAYSNFVMRGY